MSLTIKDSIATKDTFNDWHEIDDALRDEITAAIEKQTEISLFDGKCTAENKESFFYRFTLNENDFIDPNNITEIRYKDKVIQEAFVTKIKNNKVTIQIPKTTSGLPKRIPVLILVNDPSFILQQLKEALLSIKNNHIDPGNFIEPIFGSKSAINQKYHEEYLTPDGDFSYNTEQLNALEKSIKNKILFIWGPPGTGKTTVLGKIISDYVKRDESVLLCSNTNRAVDVSILKALEVSDYEITPIKEKSLRWGNVFLTQEEDLQYVTFESHIARCRREKEKLIQDEVDLLNEHKDASKTLNNYKLKIRPYKLAKRRYDEIVSKNILNDHQKNELKRLKKKLKDLQPGQGSIEDDINNLHENVKRVEGKILESFESVDDLREFVIRETTVTAQEVLSDIRFQAATFARAVVEENLQEQEFDNLLIDEASMANLPYILYLCTFAKKRIIFVGDPQQLAPIVLSKGRLAEKWLKKDIFLKVASVSDVEGLFQWQRNNSDISVLLTDQYRMPEKVFNIVNDLFYAGRLINRTNTVGSIRIIDTSEINPPLTFPSEKIKSPVNVNHSELLIKDVLETLSPIEDKIDAAQSVGVMVPFTQQKRFIQYLSQIRYLPNSLEIGVVHTFQGREKPKVYFDLTLSNIDYTYPTFDEFKTSKTYVSRLLNVAISRCQSSSDDYFDGEFVLLANIDYFKNHHPNGIVLEFINALVENADTIDRISETINPLKLSFQEDDQLDVFEQVAEKAPDEEVVEVEVEKSSEEPVETVIPKIVDEPTNQRILKDIEKRCRVITKEIQIINHYGDKIKGGDIFQYTSAIDEVLANLPITFCQNKNSFKLFIDMMYKLIYESTGGKNAVYPIWDRNAKFGKESYGKIRLVIHQLRNYYFHDYETWDQESQNKLLTHVQEFFNKTIAKDDPDEDDEWINIQLAILFKVTEYLKEVSKKYKRKVGD